MTKFVEDLGTVTAEELQARIQEIETDVVPTDGGPVSRVTQILHHVHLGSQPGVYVWLVWDDEVYLPVDTGATQPPA